MDGLLNLISGPWTTYILWLIRQNGELRFGEIKKQLPQISAKVLTERLRKLEAAGILNRTIEPTIPPKVSYKFTKRGEDLEEILDQINGLALKWSGPRKKSPEACVAGRKD
jgi:DNA-binding HxlR family transcriptional regulator